MQSSINKTKCAIPEDFEITTKNKDDLEAQRIGAALSHCGVSITLTSISSVVAFAIGSFADIPAITSFCMYSTLCFGANYITQFLIYVPIIILDERRIKQNRNCCCCCYTHTNNYKKLKNVEIYPENSSGFENSNETSAMRKKKRNANNLSAAVKGYNTLDSAKMNSKTEQIMMDGDTTATLTSDSNDGKWAHLVFDYIIIPLLSRRIFRLFIILIFVAACGFSIYALKFIDSSSDNSNYAPDDSFSLDYLEESEKAFKDEALSKGYIIMLNENFADDIIRNHSLTFINEFEDRNYSGNADGHIIGKVNHWLYEFESYLNDTYNISSYKEFSKFYNESTFYYYLQEFANNSNLETDYKQWQTEIKYGDYDDNGNPTIVKATRWTVDMSKSTDMKIIWDIRQDWNRILRDNMNYNGVSSDEAGFVFEETFGLAYFITIVVNLTIKSVLFSGAGVFVVLLCLVDLRMAIFCIIVIFMIDIDLVGWMIVFDIAIDPLVYVSLVVAVGLTVDYVLHISHAIEGAAELVGSDWNADNYSKQIRLAMSDMGIDVSKGALTTFCGIVPLFLSRSEAFRVFCQMFTGVIVIAILHGLLFVPAILGEIPFVYRQSKSRTNSANENYNGKNEDMKSNLTAMTDMTLSNSESDHN